MGRWRDIETDDIVQFLGSLEGHQIKLVPILDGGRCGDPNCPSRERSSAWPPAWTDPASAQPPQRHPPGSSGAISGGRFSPDVLLQQTAVGNDGFEPGSISNFDVPMQSPCACGNVARSASAWLFCLNHSTSFPGDAHCCHNNRATNSAPTDYAIEASLWIVPRTMDILTTLPQSIVPIHPFATIFILDLP